MAANSKNTLDVFKWIFDMIDTSKTSDHLVGCNKLSHLYFKKYQELRLFDVLMNKIGIKLKELK